jgi:preprotein translocase subunit SecF
MFNFIKWSRLYALISLVVIGVGLFSIIKWGFIYSVDFTGGTSITYQTAKKLDQKTVETVLARQKVQVRDVTVEATTVSLRAAPLDEQAETTVKLDLEKTLNTKLTLLRSETVGPILGKEMMRKTAIASVVAIIGILLYMTFAFKGVTFAVAAIIALLHDFLVVVGMYSLMSHFWGAQVDTLFVTAVLTSMSFSVHDTIVIFDKIREYVRREGRGTLGAYANRALTETLVRSLNNSMTIIFMLLALTLLGGSTIKFFVATLLIGTITGTYSSPFVATPIVVWLEKLRKRTV